MFELDSFLREASTRVQRLFRATLSINPKIDYFKLVRGSPLVLSSFQKFRNCGVSLGFFFFFFFIELYNVIKWKICSLLRNKKQSTTLRKTPVYDGFVKITRRLGNVCFIHVENTHGTWLGPRRCRPCSPVRRRTSTSPVCTGRSNGT